MGSRGGAGGAVGTLLGVDWIAVFQEIGARVYDATAGLSGTEAGRRELERGAGGDITVEIDRRAEGAALAVLERLAREGAAFTIVSEEVGTRRLGADHPIVLLDPIDGSLNAKQGIPLYSTMLSVLDGPHVEDTLAGYVRNLVSGEEWWARRGEGAFHDGHRVEPLKARSDSGIELLGVESSPRSLLLARGLIERSEKVRVLGSMALSIAHTAAGSFDVFCSPIRARIFDMTASLLIAAETGAMATDLDGGALAGKEVGLQERTSLLVGATPELHRTALRLYHEPVSLK